MVIEIDKDAVISEMSSGNYYIRNFDPRQVNTEELQECFFISEIERVGFLEEYKRRYPSKRLTASILGFVDNHNKGVSGIELSWDKELAFQDGYEINLQDAAKKKVPNSLVEKKDARNGNDLYLTIDVELCGSIDARLNDFSDKRSELTANVIVMNSSDGKILAIMDYPFIENGEGSFAIKNEIAAEPVAFLLLMAKHIEDKGISLDDISFNIDNKRTGIKTVFVESDKINNKVIAKFAGEIAPNQIQKFFSLFSFSQTTSISLPGEVSGQIKAAELSSKGTGLLGTSLQISKALAIIVNGGCQMTPVLVSKVAYSTISKVKGIAQKAKEKIILRGTADALKSILIAKVNQGSEKKLKIIGYTQGALSWEGSLDTPLMREEDEKIGVSAGFVSINGNDLIICAVVSGKKQSNDIVDEARNVFRSTSYGAISYFEKN